MPRRDEPNPLAAAIGLRLRGFREARGWNLERVAFESGLASKGHLSDIEHGRVVPTVATLLTLATHFGVELLDLVVFPERGGRHLLVDRARDAPTEMIERWLRELDERRSPSTNRDSQSAPDAVPYANVSSDHAADRVGVRDVSLSVLEGPRAPRNGVALVDLRGVDFSDPAGVRAGGRWIRLDARSRALPGAFAARVEGNAMAPRVPDGSVCLFRRPAPGNRRGRVFLVDLRGHLPIADGPYALRLVERGADGDARVTLRALAPELRPVVVDTRHEPLRIVAELVRVVGESLAERAT